MPSLLPLFPGRTRQRGAAHPPGNALILIRPENLPMAVQLNVVAVNGSAQQPSRTLALLQALIAELQAACCCAAISSTRRDRPSARRRAVAPGTGERRARAARDRKRRPAAGGGTGLPGSYPGHFKHLFDTVGQRRWWTSRCCSPPPAAATAMPRCWSTSCALFGFLQALTLPIGVFAGPADFESYQSAARRWRHASAWPPTAPRRCSPPAAGRPAACRLTGA